MVENLVELPAAGTITSRPNRAGFIRLGIGAAATRRFPFQRLECGIQGTTGMAGNSHTQHQGNQQKSRQNLHTKTISAFSSRSQSNYHKNIYLYPRKNAHL